MSPAKISKIEKNPNAVFCNYLEIFGNEDKMTILGEIIKKNDKASEIAQKLNKSQSTISHHIDFLEERDIIRGKKEGKFIRYSLNEEKFKDFLNLWNQWYGTITNWEK